jgi:hypothetical protein
MRGIRVLGAVSAATAVVLQLGTATPACASDQGVELNGTYRVISNGEWAKANYVFKDQRTVVQTWTMSSTCTSPLTCSGEVASDKGWTAPLVYKGDYWLVEHVIENWLPCPQDGTAHPGTQKFIFWGWDAANSQTDMKKRDVLPGRDRTVGPSGACGINRPLAIEMPLRLEKVS